MTLPVGLARVLDGDPPAPTREAPLRALRDAVSAALDAGRPPRLLFVCTHNSRRSQLAQVWARVAALRHGFDEVETYSGGTEVTAVHPAVIGALESAGFRAERAGDGVNPEYRLRFDADTDPVVCTSKTFDDPRNPQAGFVAVMTCAEADAACPSVPGADVRISLPYVDPRSSDGTPDEADTYVATSRRVAREMDWVFRGLDR